MEDWLIAVEQLAISINLSVASLKENGINCLVSSLFKRFPR